MLFKTKLLMIQAMLPHIQHLAVTLTAHLDTFKWSRVPKQD